MPDPKDLTRRAERALWSWASKTIYDAQQESPIDTGTLQGSHQIQELSGHAGSFGLRMVTANVNYAKAVHARNPWFQRVINRQPDLQRYILNQMLQE